MLPERVIRNGAVEQNRWQFVGLEADEPVPEALPAGPIVVPLATWGARREELLARLDPVGVWLKPDDDPQALTAGDVDALAIIAVHFPKFADGRGYSTAILLRTRLGYRGELRAIGDVGRDQLFYLKRCGFDSFSLAAHRDPEAALASLQDFSLSYQATVEEGRPLFRRRELTGTTR